MKARLFGSMIALTAAIGCTAAEPVRVTAPVGDRITQTVAPESDSRVSEAVEDPADLTITINGGTVTPAAQSVGAVAGEEILVRVDSDTEGSLRVLTTPERSFDITAESGQDIRFPVEEPGLVTLELDGEDAPIATIVVRPDAGARPLG